MRFRYIVEIEINRTQGKFATRDEIGEQLREALENADTGSFEGTEGGEYETLEWSVNEDEIPRGSLVQRAIKQSKKQAPVEMRPEAALRGAAIRRKQSKQQAPVENKGDSVQ